MSAISRHEANMRAGLGQLEAVKSNSSSEQKLRLKKLDIRNRDAADKLNMELSRGAKIDYDNAISRQNRFQMASYAKSDKDALDAGNIRHQMHKGALDEAGENLALYETMRDVMEKREDDIPFILADATHAADAQAQIVKGKFSSLYNWTEATQDVFNELGKMTKMKGAINNYMDPIIGGLRVLNMRGDTDLVRRQLENLLERDDVKIGTHAMQSIASFCMFDVKDSDPTLRRFGKYINLQTAKMFNEADPSERRTRKDISLYEYINGEYINRDENGNVIRDANGNPEIKKVSKPATVLLKGTSQKAIERTALPNLNEMILKNSVDLTVDENGKEVGTFNYEKFKENQRAHWNAILPNILGDHYSYLTGSEQIVALGKILTGVDIDKHTIDWEGIFGKENASRLTTEQKNDYLDFLYQRAKTFLGVQVPAQIARTKSDILESVVNQYALKEAMEHDEDLREKIMEPGSKLTKQEFSRIKNQYMDGIKKRFVGSYKEDALKGFVKMHHKGYQGEAKDGLIQLLDPDVLYEQFFSSRNKNDNRNARRNDHDFDDEDEDDGMPVGSDDATNGGMDEGLFGEEKVRMEEIFGNYRGREADVSGFWAEIKDAIPNVPSREIIIDQIENGLPQYTSVVSLFSDLMNMIYGGFSG